MSWRGPVLLLLLVLALAHAACGPTPGVSRPERPAARPYQLITDPLPPWIDRVMQQALAEIARTEGSGLTDARTIALQRVPSGERWALFVADEVDTGRARIVPKICGVLPERLAATGVQACNRGRCAPLDIRQTPTIVCNRDVFFGFYHFLYRWWGQHDLVWDAITDSGDRSAMSMAESWIKSANDWAWDFPDEPLPYHIVFRDVALAAFLVTHELAHLTKSDLSSAGPGEAAAAAAPASAARPAAKWVACRNFQEFRRKATRLSRSFDISDADVDALVNDAGSDVGPRAKREWQAEVGADEVATRTLGRLVHRAASVVGRPRAITSAHEALLAIAMMGWYRDMSRFARGYCQELMDDESGIPHFGASVMTQCMCDASTRENAVQLLGHTHPPITLRMFVAAGQLLSDEDMSQWHPAIRGDWSRGAVLMLIANQFSMTLSYDICQEGRVAVAYPELRGARSEPPVIAPPAPSSPREGCKENDPPVRR
jgi:hypothetical protein